MTMPVDEMRILCGENASAAVRILDAAAEVPAAAFTRAARLPAAPSTARTWVIREDLSSRNV